MKSLTTSVFLGCSKTKKEEDLSAYIKNLHTTQVVIVKTNQFIVPITINLGNEDCYLVSPSVHYVKYALSEISNLRNKMVLGICKFLGAILSYSARVGKIDKTVYINNWLIASNPNIDLTSSEISALTLKLKNE